MLWDDTSTPLTNLIGFYDIHGRYVREYSELCNAKPYKTATVAWHKDVLGKQERCFTGSEHRMWVWSGDNWRVFVSNHKGICFEVRDGLALEDCLKAWDEYRTKMGILIGEVNVASLRSLTTDLYGEDRVDEGLLIEQLLAQLEKQEAALKTGFVCPHCKTVPVRVSYCGYYDNFDYWDCECGSDVPVDHKVRGAYA